MKRHACRRAQQGLSLVELLLGLAITAMVMVPLLDMLSNATMAARITGPRYELQRQADFAVQRIAARVSATATRLLPAQDSKTSGSWLDPVTYLVSKGALVEQRKNGDEYVLADSVGNFSITAPEVAAGWQLVRVDLTLTLGTTTVSTSTTARLGGDVRVTP
jgi:Tfp pilus assembly protein FimT